MWDVFRVGPQVQRSPVFRRDGADIHSDLHVSVAQAILGGTARTQGLYESLNLSVRLTRDPALCVLSKMVLNCVFKILGRPHPQIPVGVQTDQRICLNGKGIARVSGYGFGDHYVHIKIKIPK